MHFCNICLNCARSPSEVIFDDGFVALATRNPSITINSLVATSGSKPTFRHGTIDAMQTFLSRNRGRVYIAEICIGYHLLVLQHGRQEIDGVKWRNVQRVYTLTRQTVPLVTSSWKWLTSGGRQPEVADYCLFARRYNNSQYHHWSLLLVLLHLPK